jgi:hypothetical protein
LRVGAVLHVRGGHYGDVKLDNLSFVRVGRWEGDLWARQATGVGGMYIDDHADDAQMAALSREVRRSQTATIALRNYRAPRRRAGTANLAR